MNDSALSLVTEGPDDTLAVGRRLAGLLRPGDILLLSGRLGCGKTLLAGGIAEGLGVEGPVASPTFVLVNSYHGFLPFTHADVYRLGSSAEFDDLELPAQTADGVLVIEWGDAIAARVPPDHLVIQIEIVDGSTRRITFQPMGSWTGRPLQELTA
jgi:tRNA threonylcarbamoyladenosine biosynthesis protein TsaE